MERPNDRFGIKGKPLRQSETDTDETQTARQRYIQKTENINNTYINYGNNLLCDSRIPALAGSVRLVCGSEQRRCELPAVSYRCQGGTLQDCPCGSVGRSPHRSGDERRNDGRGTPRHHAPRQLHLRRGDDDIPGGDGYRRGGARHLQHPRHANLHHGVARLRASRCHLHPGTLQDERRPVAHDYRPDELQ